MWDFQVNLSLSLGQVCAYSLTYLHAACPFLRRSSNKGNRCASLYAGMHQGVRREDTDMAAGLRPPLLLSPPPKI